MAAEGTEGMQDSEAIPISAIFSLELLISPERRVAIVSRVLNDFQNLPVAARNTLRSAVNDEIIPTTGGFRRGQAGRALDRSSFLLQEPVLQAVVSSKALAAAVLHSWSESHSQLKEAVERHLTGRGLTTPGPDLPEKLFRGHWPVDQWEVERESFAQTYDGDFDQEDVALMMCYVSGNFPKAPDSDTGQGVAVSLNDVLSASLSRLRELPATAPDWERGIPDFIASVSRLVEEKAAQLRWSEEFDAIILETRDAYGELLAFFECDTRRWAAARVSPEADSAATLKLAAKLKAQLAEYLPTHGLAPSISEERDRNRKRGELQPAILETLQAISSLMNPESEGTDEEPFLVESSALSTKKASTMDAPAVATEQLPHLPAPSVHAPSVHAPSVHASSIEPPSPEQEPPQATMLKGAHSSVESATFPSAVALDEMPAVNVAEYTALQSENLGLRDTAQALRSENQDLRDEVESLKTELFTSQEREDSWRLAYRAVMDGSLEDVGVPPPLVESVHDAVEMAKNQFRQELLFAPNSESSVEDNPFVDPGRVWEALKWLATTYYSSRMGRLRVTDFDQSIKEACGWWYKSDQGETTVSRYKDSYTTRVDGRRYTLVEHIGKGTTFDARYTIRIAFDWDRDRRQVIVGYLGRHQQTDAS